MLAMVLEDSFLDPNFVPSAGTLNVGHGPVTTVFLGLTLFLVPMTPCDGMLYCMLLYWPHTSALVAYNGGTTVGHGHVRTLFLSMILFPVPAHWMLAMALLGLFSWA